MLLLALCDPSLQIGNMSVALKETSPPVKVPGSVRHLGLTHKSSDYEITVLCIK